MAYLFNQNISILHVSLCLFSLEGEVQVKDTYVQCNTCLYVLILTILLYVNTEKKTTTKSYLKPEVHYDP